MSASKSLKMVEPTWQPMTDAAVAPSSDGPQPSVMYWRVRRTTCKKWRNSATGGLRRGLCRSFLLNLCKQHAMKHYKKSLVKLLASNPKSNFDVVEAHVEYDDAALTSSVARVCGGGHHKKTISGAVEAAPELSVTSTATIINNNNDEAAHTTEGGRNNNVVIISVTAALRDVRESADLAVCSCKIRARAFPHSHL